MGDILAHVNCVCVLLVAQTRLRRLVADCGNFVLRCFVRWATGCGGGCDGKEVIMEMILFAFFGFILGVIIGSVVAGIVANSINDKILESSNELCDSCGKTLIETMDKMYEYGRKVKELEEKTNKRLFRQPRWRRCTSKQNTRRFYHTQRDGGGYRQIEREI